jgi:hypothetical protein
MGSCGGLLRGRIRPAARGCRHGLKSIVVAELARAWLALFAEPASAGGRHNRSGSCVGCNLKPSKVVNTSSKVHHTRVVHHTKVIPTTRVVNHNRLVLHKHTLNHRHLTIHKHKIVHK